MPTIQPNPRPTPGRAAACTDGLRAAADRIGTCFRPLTDLAVPQHIKRKASGNSDTGEQAANQAPRDQLNELFGLRPDPEQLEPPGPLQTAPQPEVPPNQHPAHPAPAAPDF